MMTPSIRIGLLKSLIAPLLVLNFVGGGLIYWVAWGPAQAAFDQNLTDTARTLVTRLRFMRSSVRLDLPGRRKT